MDDDTSTPSDMDTALAERLARVSADLQEAAAMAAAGAKPRHMDGVAAAAAFHTLWAAISDDETLADLQAQLSARHMAAIRALAAGEPDAKADEDARFSNASWTDNPFFDYVRRIYLETSAWAMEMVDAAPDLSAEDRKAARFFLRQALAAAAPTNSLALNPRALDAFMNSNGQSAEAGVNRLKSDLAALPPRLSPSHIDEDAFVVGDSLAATPGEIVFRNELIELIRYHPTTPDVFAEPILIFPPWINKFYVLDLQPGRSLVEWLVDQGFSVYIVSWRNADDEIATFDWDDYVERGALAALETVSQHHDAPIHAVGYCVGGTLLASVAAYRNRRADAPFASTTFFAAQTDFSDAGDLSTFATPSAIADVDAVMADNGGLMPGEMMIDAFNMLRPEDLIWRYVEDGYLLGRTPKRFDVLYWNADQTNIPAPLHRGYLQQFYVENALARGVFRVLGDQVSLSDVRGPCFVHAAETDHISPFPSVFRGAQAFGGEIDFLLSGSGHIAGVVNPPSDEKYGYSTGGDIKSARSAEDWRDQSTHHEGSWWPVWTAWLEARCSGRVSPPSPLTEAEPAPGRYVLETLESIEDKRRGRV